MFFQKCVVYVVFLVDVFYELCQYFFNLFNSISSYYDFVEGDQVNWVDISCIVYVNFVQVVCSQEQVFVQFIGDDQYIFQSYVFQFLCQQFSFWCFYREFFDNDQMILMYQFGQDVFQCVVVYFFVNFLIVVLWMSSKGYVIRMLDWVFDRIRMCMVGVFLVLWFFIGISYFSMSFLGMSILMSISCISNNNLVNQCFVEIMIEGSFGNSQCVLCVF